MNDDRLRNAFDELRRAEMASAPKFAPLVAARGPAPTLKPVLQFAFLLLIVIVASLVPLVRRPQPSITTWKAPTDFLLATPGRELLQSTPDLRGIRR